jgi:hypothetical protein
VKKSVRKHNLELLQAAEARLRVREAAVKTVMNRLTGKDKDGPDFFPPFRFNVKPSYEMKHPIFFNAIQDKKKNGQTRK